MQNCFFGWYFLAFDLHVYTCSFLYQNKRQSILHSQFIVPICMLFRQNFHFSLQLLLCGHPTIIILITDGIVCQRACICPPQKTPFVSLDQSHSFEELLRSVQTGKYVIVKTSTKLINSSHCY